MKTILTGKELITLIKENIDKHFNGDLDTRLQFENDDRLFTARDILGMLYDNQDKEFESCDKKGFVLKRKASITFPAIGK